MLKLASVVSSFVGLAAMALASGASAQTWAPAPIDGWTLSGNLQVQNTANLNCNVNGHASTTSSNTGVINTFNFTPGDFLCSFLGENLPWAITPLSTGPSGTGPGIRIALSVTALVNTCAGTIDGDYDNAGKITFPFGTQVVGSSTACYVEGEVYLTPDHNNSSTLIITP